MSETGLEKFKGTPWEGGEYYYPTDQEIASWNGNPGEAVCLACGESTRTARHESGLLLLQGHGYLGICPLTRPGLTGDQNPCYGSRQPPELSAPGIHSFRSFMDEMILKLEGVIDE